MVLILKYNIYHLENLGNGIGRNLLPEIFTYKIFLKFKNFLKFFFLFQLGNKVAYEAYLEGGEDALKEYIYSKMWNPEYRPLVYLPPGKGE